MVCLTAVELATGIKGQTMLVANTAGLQRWRLLSFSGLGASATRVNSLACMCARLPVSNTD